MMMRNKTTTPFVRGSEVINPDLWRANGGIRTLDLALTKRLLYQLSYVGVPPIIPVRFMNAQDN